MTQYFSVLSHLVLYSGHSHNQRKGTQPKIWISGVLSTWLSSQKLMSDRKQTWLSWLRTVRRKTPLWIRWGREFVHVIPKTRSGNQMTFICMKGWESALNYGKLNFSQALPGCPTLTLKKFRLPRTPGSHYISHDMRACVCKSIFSGIRSPESCVTKQNTYKGSWQ